MAMHNQKSENVSDISTLNDDLLGLILNRVSSDGNDRKSISQVSKHWFRVEAQTRTSIRLRNLGYLRRILSRFPNLVTFQTSEKQISKAHLVFLAQTCPKIETINLKTTGPLDESFTVDSLCSLSNRCPRLSQVSLGGRRFMGGGIWLKKAHNLTWLDLGRNRLNDDYLEAIGSCSLISYLNLESCIGISQKGLRLLAKGPCSKSLKTLVLAQATFVTDGGVMHLKKMTCLEDLNLESCRVTDFGVIAISGIQSLRKLNLSKLLQVSGPSIIALAENCLGLEMLDISGCEVTSEDLGAFSGHVCLNIVK